MRILEVCVDLDGGGIDRYLYNYCSRIKTIQFDFALVEQTKTGILEEPIRNLGSNIYYLPRLQDGLTKNYNALKKLLVNNSYDAVHVHLGVKSFVALCCAKRCGVKSRIVHAHIACEPESIKQRFIRKICATLSKHYATDLAACGIEAAKWVWGEKDYYSGKVKIHNNAIDTKQFAFDSEIRRRNRKKLGLTGKMVVGNVGRICEQKNQIRLLEIFCEIHKRNQHSVLLLIGRDSLNGECEHLAEKLGIYDSVMFLGVRDDVDKLLNVMDVFVFPSLYEGLPFTLVEAECNGVPIVFSDSITRELLINNNVEMISLDDTNEDWAIKAFEVYERGREYEGVRNIKLRGFDLDEEAKKLEEYYKKVIVINNEKRQ